MSDPAAMAPAVASAPAIVCVVVGKSAGAGAMVAIAKAAEVARLWTASSKVVVEATTPGGGNMERPYGGIGSGPG